MDRLLCASERNLEGIQIFCDRRYGHSSTQMHRAILADCTVIVWEGEFSRGIPPRTE